jgi:hypothetical protein
LRDQSVDGWAGRSLIDGSVFWVKGGNAGECTPAWSRARRRHLRQPPSLAAPAHPTLCRQSRGKQEPGRKVRETTRGGALARQSRKERTALNALLLRVGLLLLDATRRVIRCGGAQRLLARRTDQTSSRSSVRRIPRRLELLESCRVDVATAPIWSPFVRVPAEHELKDRKHRRLGHGRAARASGVTAESFRARRPRSASPPERQRRQVHAGSTGGLRGPLTWVCGTPRHVIHVSRLGTRVPRS